MEMREVPDPEIKKDTDVLVKMSAVGVCGSDIHYYTSGKIGSQVVEFPFTLGHESAGVVEAVGAGVTRFKPGDRIAVDPAMSCYACQQCKAGRPHTCLNLSFLGCPGQAEGSISEYLVMPEASCFALEDRTSLEVGALSEPLTIGVYACRLAGEMSGARVGVLGAGPIGLSVTLPALSLGASNVYITDKIDKRLEVARKAGVAWTGNPDTEDVVAAVSDTEPHGLDYVFECCGQQEAVDQAVEMLAPGGKLIMVGIPEVDRLSFTMDRMRRKEICFQNVRRQNDCTQLTIDMIESGCIDGEFMITHRFPFEKTKEAFDLVTNYEDGVVKAMINFD
jgi:L-iditol 2-dehydrogenase